MTIPIIGQALPTPTVSPLAAVDVELPVPTTVAATQPIHSAEQIRAYLKHPESLVRVFALQRMRFWATTEAADAARHLIDDPDERVAALALGLVAADDSPASIDAIAARFRTTQGNLAGRAGAALARLAPARVLEELKTRARLDDEAYTPVVLELARSNLDEVPSYLAKSMNRAGVLNPMRRSALYTAALLSGAAELCERVFSLAIVDSKPSKEETPPSAARIAVATMAGLPTMYAAPEAGADLLKQMRDDTFQVELENFSEEIKNALADALRHNRPDQAIEAFASNFAANPSPSQVGPAARRSNFLLALFGQITAIKALEPNAQAVFLAAAVEAASLIIGVAPDLHAHPGLKALAQQLGLTVEALVALDAAALITQFAQRSEREARRLSNILDHQPFEDQALFERIVLAMLEAGHGSVLLDVASASKSGILDVAIRRTFRLAPASAEPVLLEALQRRPLDGPVAATALAAAGSLGTERLSLAIGRRFLELRQVDRLATIDAIALLGDARLAPVIEKRTYFEEPEEIAWSLLSLLGGQPIEGRLVETLGRWHRRPAEPQLPETSTLPLPLQCTHCAESLNYSIKRVFIDPRSKKVDRDPIFAGDIRCKACGAADTLTSTTDATQIISEELINVVMQAREGLLETPLVWPRTLIIDGRELGVAEALRQAETALARSPHSVRYLLRRARLRALLLRSDARSDVDAILAQAPDSIEGLVILGTILLDMSDATAAAEPLMHALRLLVSDEEPRLYEVDQPTILAQTVELLRTLQRSEFALPEDIQGILASQARAEATLREKEPELAETPTLEAQVSPPDKYESVGRNDPCPCGSGQKFKRCHGR